MVAGMVACPARPLNGPLSWAEMVDRWPLGGGREA
jgi:hypothetical protein